MGDGDRKTDQNVMRSDSRYDVGRFSQLANQSDTSSKTIKGRTRVRELGGERILLVHTPMDKGMSILYPSPRVQSDHVGPGSKSRDRSW